MPARGFRVQRVSPWFIPTDIHTYLSHLVFLTFAMKTFAVLANIADLVLARQCLACDRTGSPLCNGCWNLVAGNARKLEHDWLPLTVGTDYAGIGRALVLAHKRSLQRTLARPLGQLLASAIRELEGVGPRLTLVPMPPHRTALRARGQDTVAAITHQAQAHLRQRGWILSTASALRFARNTKSLAGLNRRERMAHMAGAFTADCGRGVDCVIVDDVITTGATMQAAATALTTSGWNVLGGSAVAGVR
jgi:predicted amidophosphoribosyltransferase